MVLVYYASYFPGLFLVPGMGEFRIAGLLDALVIEAGNVKDPNPGSRFSGYMVDSILLAFVIFAARKEGFNVLYIPQKCNRFQPLLIS